MNAFKTILFVALVAACVVAEPPRRRFGFRKFARQEVEDSGSTPEEQPEAEEKPGYEYAPPPDSQRLRLPSRVRVTSFARQEEAPPSNGYSYPKPDPTYGPPEDNEPTYGPPEDNNPTYGPPEDNEPSEPPSTDYGVPETTINPQAEQLKSIRASQFRRQNGKFVKSQKLVRAKQQQQPQPIFYFQYPVSSDFGQQYTYIF